jgi:hypothetical protein
VLTVLTQLHALDHAVIDDRKLRDLEGERSAVGAEVERPTVARPRQDIRSGLLGLEYDPGEPGIRKIPDALDGKALFRSNCNRRKKNQTDKEGSDYGPHTGWHSNIAEKIVQEKALK